MVYNLGRPSRDRGLCGIKILYSVFKAIGLVFKKKTHSGRSGGARVAELQGVDENSIRRAGHWNQDAMSNCYLTALPRDFLHTMAGFKPVDLLLDLPPQPPLVQAGKQQVDTNDLAAQGFLKLLQQLCMVLLQDATMSTNQFELLDHFCTISSQVDDLISGQISFTVRANGPESGLEQSNLALAIDSVQSAPIQRTDPEDEKNMIQEQPQQASLAVFTQMPSYKLSRTIKTVRELWAEWTIGLNGQPAVQALEQQYGAKWRSDSKERVMFDT
ncbi:hypothetical protein TSTA_001330 [Talaromyces stipitatus ATCC 10500]|uniref:Transcription activator GCR1-like domain-containing protein n=1 Tax=Talaromyces stipitatus (strain ATCC 10500 / CBS 375.48 / QM 6759 / NRRL 1006) TaxID=441959 RepID=B8MS17_TALSN|nr:uncharacterized protein TSTA_001330 [Talaromyces stipitatus ATCC 10500]EED12062.1 hypothetical protein TSTA_001330 [Talaromyces stipitatus ATCC 10500]